MYSTTVTIVKIVDTNQMSESTFPFNDAEGAAVTISVPDDADPVGPTVSDLDGSAGRVIETTTKDAGITTIDVASILLDGEQYIVTENDSSSVILYADGVEVYVPIDCIHVET